LAPFGFALHFKRFRVIHVVTAIIADKRRTIMTSTTETETTPDASAEQPKAPKKAPVGARRANVAPAKPKPGKKATPAKKAPESAKRAKVAEPEAREGRKTAKILDLLKRPGGATSKELQKTTGWQPHSLRGFLSGTIGKKMGLAVTCTKSEDGERTYSVKS
jgi:hypothetical protein